MTPGDGSKLYRWWFLFNFRRFGLYVTCTTSRRLKGFEPVRTASFHQTQAPVLRKLERLCGLAAANVYNKEKLHVIFGLWEIGFVVRR